MATVAPNGRRAPRVIEATVEPGRAGLAQALLDFHAQAPKLRPDADGQIQNRVYRYVTLDSLLDDVEPLLLQHGLLWSAKVILADGQPAALYRMEHVPSGESEEWTGPLPCVEPGPQNLGSAITYMRRYTLQAYLNLAPGEDDDGAAASEQARPQARPNGQGSGQGSGQSSGQSSQPTARPPQSSERRITSNQRTKLLVPRAEQAGLSDGEFANVILAAAGELPRTWRSPEHAKQTLDRLLDQLPARLKDAVLEGIAGAKS